MVPEFTLSVGFVGFEKTCGHRVMVSVSFFLMPLREVLGMGDCGGVAATKVVF